MQLNESNEGFQALVEQYHEAARTGDCGQMRKLVQNGLPKDARNVTGETALHIAALEGAEASVAFLIDEFKVYTNVLNDFGQNPLHFAAQGKNIRIVQKLVQSGTDVIKQDLFGNIPEKYADRKSKDKASKFSGEHSMIFSYIHKVRFNIMNQMHEDAKAFIGSSSIKNGANSKNGKKPDAVKMKPAGFGMPVCT